MVNSRERKRRERGGYVTFKLGEIATSSGKMALVRRLNIKTGELGDMEAGGKPVIPLGPRLSRRAEKAAAERGITTDQLVETALSEFLPKPKGKGKHTS